MQNPMQLSYTSRLTTQTGLAQAAFGTVCIYRIQAEHGRVIINKWPIIEKSGCSNMIISACAVLHFMHI